MTKKVLQKESESIFLTRNQNTMVTYIYTGKAPLGFSYDGQQYLLTEGDTVSLDGTNALIDGLIAQGLLVVTRDRAENFVGDGRVLNYVVPSGQTVAAGALVAVGNIVGVAQTEGAAGETVVLSLDGLWEFDAAVAITAGDRVYRSSGTAVNKTDTNPFVGVAVGNSAAGKVRVRVLSTGDGGGGEPLVYAALISQSGTNAPVATVLKNTTGHTATWSRTDTGDYLLQFEGMPSGANLLVFTSSSDPYQYFVSPTGAGGVGITTFLVDLVNQEILSSDDLMISVSIKIEYYP